MNKVDRTKSHITIPAARIEEFCHRWDVSEFALFGSVLRDDFRPDSDVDVLVSFLPDAPVSLFDLARMERELESLFGRAIGLVEKEGLRNPFRKREILQTREIVYAA